MNTHGIRYKETGEWLKELDESPIGYRSEQAAWDDLNEKIQNADKFFRVEPLPEE